MRHRFQRTINFLLAGSFLAALSISCQEPLEACLDIEASNFDVRADRNCCCIYPSLFVEVAYRAGEVSFNLNSPYEMDNGDTVIFRRAAFYLSELTVFQGSQEFFPRDTFLIYQLNNNNQLDSTEYVGNLSLINRTASDINMGRFTESGFFDLARFRLGLNETLNSQNIDILPRRSRLSIQADSMHTFTSDGGYLFLKFEIFVPALDELFELTLTGDDGDFVLTRPIEMVSVTGINKRFRLNINYLEWIRGINFGNDTPEERKQKLINNLPNALVTIQ